MIKEAMFVYRNFRARCRYSHEERQVIMNYFWTSYRAAWVACCNAASETEEFQELDQARLIQRIKDALGTAEDGEALIEVARNAHKAELELAYMNIRGSER